jgi:hypothetical protein
MVLPISSADEGERLNQLAAERHLAESVAGPLRAQHRDRLTHIENQAQEACSA